MRRALLTVLLIPTIVIGVTSCALPTRPPQPATPTTPIVTQPDTPLPAPGPTSPNVDKLQTIVTQVEQQTGAKIGIATSTEAAGSISTGPAWSTAKVPVAIAALPPAIIRLPHHYGNHWALPLPRQVPPTRYYVMVGTLRPTRSHKFYGQAFQPSVKHNGDSSTRPVSRNT